MYEQPLGLSGRNRHDIYDRQGLKPLLPYENVCLKEKRDITLEDVAVGKATLEDLVAQMSVEELAELSCGTGWGVANEKPSVGANSATVAGAAGETTRTCRRSTKYRP